MSDDKKKLWQWDEAPSMFVMADGGIRKGTIRFRKHLDRSFYAWDDWQQRAKAAGVPDDLAQLGRSLMREADQHGWSDELQAECGWDDDGAAMIALALSDPATARERWSWLIETDGGDDDPTTLHRMAFDDDDHGPN